MWEETIMYQPLRDGDEHVIENSADYVRRMKLSLLSNWPEEVLIEWLYRHANQMDKYAFLGFDTFCFSKETWPLDRIPGREAFEDERSCDGLSNIEERARNPHDWLAIYMLNEGTWNTPILLLRNKEGQFTFPYGNHLKQPFHLLEGHRRLSLLNGLRRIGKAGAEHDVWVVTKCED